MAGWIKLHRKISESAVFSDPDLLRLWILCLTKATHKGTNFVMDRQQITLLPGEFVTGRKSLTDEYNVGLKPRNRKKELSIWRDLKFLEECGNVNIKSTNKYSVISISKWCEYQETEQQLNNNRTTDEQQLNTNKNVKNDKNDKKEKPIVDSNECDDAFEKWYALYPKQGSVRKEALAKWKTLWKEKKIDLEKMTNGTNSYIQYQSNNGFRTCGAQVFLNQERWNDNWTSVVTPFKPTNKMQATSRTVQVTEEERKENRDALNKIRERNGVPATVNG